MVGELYPVSPWRHIDINDRIIKKDTDINIIKLYNPKKYIFESPKKFDTEFIYGTVFDINTSKVLKENYNNTLSSLYSKYNVNNILQKYVCDNNIKYDCIISTRFDYLNDLITDINSIDTTKINVMYNDTNMCILPDGCIITNLEIFNKYSMAFLNLKFYIDDKNIIKECKDISGSCSMAVETCLITNLLYIYKDKEFVRNLINKRKDILDFYRYK